MAGTGALPPNWQKKPFAIVNHRETGDWVYVGTRFVSPLSMEAANAMLFESRDVAEAVANHLKLTGVCPGIDPLVSGIKVKFPDYAILKNSRMPLIKGAVCEAPPKKVRGPYKNHALISQETNTEG